LRRPHAAQKTGNTDIFVELFPMNALTFADQLKLIALLSRTVK
jgi:hypothetical protein